MSKPKSMQTALKWAFIMSWGPSTIASLLTLVLAMYLGPEEYGIVAIAALYMQFNKMFLEGGLGAAIVQRKHLDPEHLDAVFWITLILSMALMGICWVVAPYWAGVNHDAAQVTNILRIMAFVMPIQGLTVVQESLLEKTMDFKSLAIRSNVAALVGGLVGLGMAIRGWGAYALVGEDIVGAILRLALLWGLSTWRPTWTFSWPHLKELWGFSVYVLLGQIGTFVQRRSDAILIGVFFGPAAVGIYRLADRLINMVIEVATRPFVMVVLPQFSHLQDDIPALRKSVKQSVGASAMLTMPLLAILAGLSFLICQALGARGKDDWAKADHVIQILAMVGAARAVTLFVGPLVQSINKPRMFMTMSWGLAGLNTVSFCITGWWLGGHSDVQWQAMGVAIARAGVFLLVYMPLCLWIMARICKMTMREILRSMVTATFVSLIVFSVGLVLDYAARFIPVKHMWSKMGLLAVGGLITTSLAIYLMIKLDPKVREFALRRFSKKKPGRGGDGGSNHSNGNGGGSGSGGSSHGRIPAEPVEAAPGAPRVAVD